MPLYRHMHICMYFFFLKIIQDTIHSVYLWRTGEDKWKDERESFAFHFVLLCTV